MRLSAIATAPMALLALVNVSLGLECKMIKSFDQSARNSPHGKAPVWRDQSGDGKAAPLLFAGSLHVNTDGTKRSYNLDDFWGATKGLNNLCNAMSDACAGLDNNGLHDRRVTTQNAYAHGWPAAELKATRIASAIIPFKDGKPCALIDGYFVSATALTDPTKSDQCDISRYLDALNVPALVLPLPAEKGVPTGFDRNGVDVGDLLIAMVPGQSSTIIYATVGDKGPPNALGEGSIALNGKLNRIMRGPKNYKDVKQSWDVANAVVLIFPHTRDVAMPYLTSERIDAEGRKVFIGWGGGTEQGATERLQSCAEAYAKSLN